MKAKTKRKPQDIPPARTLDVKPSDYQPSKAELEERMDMPRMSLSKVRASFFRPFRFSNRKS